MQAAGQPQFLVDQRPVFDRKFRKRRKKKKKSK